MIRCDRRSGLLRGGVIEPSHKVVEAPHFACQFVHSQSCTSHQMAHRISSEVLTTVFVIAGFSSLSSLPSLRQSAHPSPLDPPTPATNATTFPSAALPPSSFSLTPSLSTALTPPACAISPLSRPTSSPLSSAPRSSSPPAPPSSSVTTSTPPKPRTSPSSASSSPSPPLRLPFTRLSASTPTRPRARINRPGRGATTSCRGSSPRRWTRCRRRRWGRGRTRRSRA